jgi:hypothetical protein
MKYIKNTLKTQVYIDKTTITSAMENNFAGKRSMECKQNQGV